MPKPLTASTLWSARLQSLAFVDESKTCETCRHKESPVCEECYDSFMGVMFPAPTEWEASDAEERGE